jgi:hypothetical protein
MAFHVFDPTNIATLIHNSFKADNTSVSLRDYNNNVTYNISDAWGCSLSDCSRLAPQSGWMFIDWNILAPNLGAWLIPWLALTAQLPFETRGVTTNLMSLAMAVGSPMLAGYSLALMVLNARWINICFANLRDQGKRVLPSRPEHYNPLNAIRWILIEVQHVPIKFVWGSNHDFAQMLVRPENTKTWENLRLEILKTKRGRTLSLFAQLWWVIIAQFLAICQLFASGNQIGNTGMGVSINTLWAWMLPVVWGWVFVGTQINATSVRDAIDSIRPTYITQDISQRFSTVTVQENREIAEENRKYSPSVAAGEDQEPLLQNQADNGNSYEMTGGLASVSAPSVDPLQFGVGNPGENEPITPNQTGDNPQDLTRAFGSTSPLNIDDSEPGNDYDDEHNSFQPIRIYNPTHSGESTTTFIPAIPEVSNTYLSPSGSTPPKVGRLEFLVDRTVKDLTEEDEVFHKSHFFGFPVEGWGKEPGPFFVFARVMSHMTACNHVKIAFTKITANLKAKSSVNGVWDSNRFRNNLSGNATQIAQYIADTHGTSVTEQPPLAVHGKPPPNILFKFFLATLIGLVLQWGTVGAAILTAYL